MPPLYPVRQLYSDITRYESIALEDVEDKLVRQGIEYWNELRGTNLYPRRQDIDARKIGRPLSNMALIEVIDHGRDFKMRVVGDEVRRAYPALLSGRLISEIATDLPKAAQRWKDVYKHVYERGKPVAMQVHVGLDGTEVNFSYAEAVCLPLGTPNEGITHLITFASHVLEITEPGHDAESAK